MNSYNASLQSLVESDRGSSNDSILAESLQLDIEELDDVEYSIPALDTIPTLESVLNDLNGDRLMMPPTPTPSTNSATSHDSKPSSILRLLLLKAVSTQVSSAADHIDAGMATSVGVSQMIAIGMSHGHILAFDSSQTLKWCCQDFTNDGAVSCLAFNVDDTRLLAGFARGRIVMFDATKGNMLRNLSEIATPNAGILHIRWTEKPALALCSDSGGSVWSLNFTRRLGVRGCEARCLFSGARGEVCTFEPLLLNEEDHPLRNYTIAALATLSKFFVVMIRPRLRVIKFHPLPGPAESMPLLSWQLVLIQLADTTKTVDPVLATARGNNLFFHQLAYNAGKINLLFLRHIKLGYDLLALHWLGPKSVAYLDTMEILHLTDVRTNKELDTIDLSELQLGYQSAQFKGLATGGNVSQAFALAGSYACYNSIVAFGSQLYVLGNRTLHVVNARAWSERLAYLTNSQRWDDAIQIAMEGFRNSYAKRQNIAKDRILSLVINDYMRATIHSPDHCLDVIISCLIEINETSLLWGELWERLNNTENYLIYITKHITNDDLTLISPAVAQSLCEYWLKRDKDKLEEVILKLDWKCLDLHQVLTMSRRAKLYKIQLYLNANALGDFTASIIDLVPLIESEPSLGNYILVYISSCLAGRSFPTGFIPETIVQNVKHEVLRCLTVYHSSTAEDDEKAYPYLRALLKYNVRETLNVLNLAFQEKEFNGDLGLSHRQRIINILLEILSPDCATPPQRGCLINFIAHEISNNNLPETDILIEQVILHLTQETIKGETDREHSEREHAWLELVSSNRLNLPKDDIIELSLRSKCFRVTEYLLIDQKKYDKVLSTYLGDPRRQYEMIQYLFRYANHAERKIYEQIKENIERLVEINVEAITKLVAENYKASIGELLNLLPKGKTLYSFLDCLIRENISLDHNIFYEIYIELLCEFNPSMVLDFLKNNETYKIDAALELCQLHSVNNATVYLYERLGDYEAAFKIAVQDINKSDDQAGEVTSLCSRASAILNATQKEKLWFDWLEIVLTQPHLGSHLKTILHAASPHVDLARLVQLILSHRATNGNIEDIRDILVCMLANSKYESVSLDGTAKILSRDLHELLEKAKKKSNRGVCIKSIKCVVCRNRLIKANCNVIVLGTCGHALHDTCLNIQKELLNKLECPRCGCIYADDTEEILLPEVRRNILDKANVKVQSKKINVDSQPPPSMTVLHDFSNS